MKNLFVRLIREDAGQDLIEYSLLTAIIAVGAIGVMQTLTGSINSIFTNISNTLNP